MHKNPQVFCDKILSAPTLQTCQNTELLIFFIVEMKTSPWLHQASEFYFNMREQTVDLITGVMALYLRLFIDLPIQDLDPYHAT